VNRSTGANRASRCRQNALAEGPQVAAVEFGADHNLARFDRERATDGGSRFGNERTDAAVQDAVGLVDAGADGDPNDDFFGSRFDDFNTEGFVDVLVAGAVKFTHGDEPMAAR